MDGKRINYNILNLLILQSDINNSECI